MISEWRQVRNEDRLEKLGHFSLKPRKLRGVLIMIHKILNNLNRAEGEKVFSWSITKRMLNKAKWQKNQK